MRRLIIISLLIILAHTAVAQPFGPPRYIANPKTGECKYYFAGDEIHFNPRPENYTLTVGFENGICDKFKLCFETGDGWDQGKCVCQRWHEFNDTVGCVPVKNFAAINLCLAANGTWNSNLSNCVCQKEFQWNETNESGCVRIKKRNFFQKVINWLKGFF